MDSYRENSVSSLLRQMLHIGFTSVPSESAIKFGDFNVTEDSMDLSGRKIQVMKSI